MNDAPIAFNQSLVTAEDTALPITILSADVDGPITNFTIVASPLHGTFSGNMPNLVYQPASNYNGVDSFTFKVDDGSLTSAVATVSLTITAVNDAPVANTQSVSTPANTAKLITLTGSDVENSPLTFAIVTSPINGVLSSFNPNTGTLTYTPSSNYWGSDSFTYQANDGATNSTPATVSLNVTPVADIATTQSGPASIAPLTNFAYTITVTNRGPTAASNVVVFDALSPNLSFVSATGGGNYVGGVVTWPALDIFPSGATTNFTVNVKSPIKGTLTNSTSSTAASGDPDSSNNNGSAASAQVITIVSPLQIENTSSASSVNSLTWGHTIFPGSSRILIVGVSIDNPTTTITSVLFNNFLPLTLIGQTNGTQSKVAMYYLLNPPIGTFPISITLNASAGVVGAAVSLKGVNQANPIAGFKGNKGTNGSANITLSSTVGGTVIATVAPKSPVAALSPGADQTSEWNRSATNYSGAGSSMFGAASVTPSWTLTSSAAWSMAAVALNYATTIADIAVVANGPNSVMATSNLTYTLTVTNRGPDTATNVVVSDALPLGASLVIAPGGGSATNGVITWPALPNFVSGATTNYSVTITAPAIGTLTNFASSTANTAEPDPSNNNGTAANAQVVTSVLPVADVGVFLSSPASSVPLGANYDYTITVTNAGPSPAESLTVIDSLPANVSLVSATGGGVANGSQVVWTNLGSLAAGMATNLTLTVSAPLRGSMTNLVSVAGPSLDLNSANNVAAPVTTTVINVSPVANKDSYTTPGNRTFTVPASGVLDNDTDSNGDPLTVIKASDPAHGTLTLSTNGGFTYTPVSNYFGSDYFTYRAFDGSTNSAVTTVALTILDTTPLKFVFAGMIANGFKLQLSGPVGGTYVILASTNLQNWTSIYTNVAPTGSMVFTDSAATNDGKFFYRAMTQ